MAEQFLLPIEKPDVGEIQSRWPQFSIPNNCAGFFEDTSGALLNEEFILGYKTLMKNYQVLMQFNTRVISINTHVDGVMGETNNKTFYADKLVVTAGAWTGKILSELDLPLQTVRKTFGWFKTNTKVFQPTDFPCFYFNFEASY